MFGCILAWPKYEQLLAYPKHNHLAAHHRLRRLVVDDDMQRASLVLHTHHRCYRLLLNYLAAGLAVLVAGAGTAAFSSLAGVLFAGFFSSFLTTAGALAAGAGVAATGAGAGAAAFGASAAKADIANTANRDAITDFILSFLRLIYKKISVYIYNAVASKLVDSMLKIFYSIQEMFSKSLCRGAYRVRLRIIRNLFD